MGGSESRPRLDADRRLLPEFLAAVDREQKILDTHLNSRKQKILDTHLNSRIVGVQNFRHE